MVLKIAVLGICVCIINVVLKHYSEQSVMFIQIAFVIAVATVMLDELKSIMQNLSQYIDYIDGGKEFITDFLKGALICILADISADMCKENGNLTVGKIIDLSGRVALIYIAFPYVSSVIKTAVAFVS